MEQTFEFLASPKLVINDTDYKLGLLANPRNAYDAENFCSLHTNNGSMYHLDNNFNTVVEFAKVHGIHIFYIGLSDTITENNFTYPNGTPLSNDFDHLWNIGEPNNRIPEINSFCEGKLLQF